MVTIQRDTMMFRNFYNGLKLIIFKQLLVFVVNGLSLHYSTGNLPALASGRPVSF